MKSLSYDEAVTFHGHEGPFLALGYKAGEYAVQKLRPEKMLDLVCVVETPGSKPYTCVIDGAQCSTPCTLGKGNLHLSPTEEREVKITFKNRKRDEEIVFVLKPEVLERVLKTEDLAREAEWVRSTPMQSLFDIQIQQIRSSDF